jgi:hypothetical protein
MPPQLKKLKWLFEFYANGNPVGCETISEKQRAREAVVLQFMADWHWKIKGEWRSFHELNDPFGRVHFPPMDAYCNKWEYIVEIKQPTSGPHTLQAKSGGLYFSVFKQTQMTILCKGTNLIICPFKYGRIVYAFPNGDVYWLALKKFDQLHELSLAPGGSRVQKVIMGRTPGYKSDRVYIIPLPYWTYAGNHKKSVFVNQSLSVHKVA